MISLEAVRKSRTADGLFEIVCVHLCLLYLRYYWQKGAEEIARYTLPIHNYPLINNSFFLFQSVSLSLSLSL